ncbi:PREDICTED: zinc finger BED domain-containing protein RICESLEEPER 2-like [Ipomoea nil]|uniref:zinc finger BED domain-containing protein RICESLEEPER 2-like n=1 Tax=Ipomoea nil TaxID=35883 RepID=UPI000900C798|nr:PREDICTED: zinc finger BED domain-containing protein RICESLEEPER 2-like [Ipomoea nil]
MVACLKNPHSKDTRQSLLTFNDVYTSGTEASEGVLGTWVFNQEAIRRALCEMIIVDELPFRIGIKNVFTVTVDNASSNDIALGFFKNKLLSWGGSSVRVQYMHMRCIAHVLNLVVQDGLRYAGPSIKKVRDVVRWVRNPHARLKKFRELVVLNGVEAKCALQLDVPTRWNSTYMMLNTALQYQRAFEAYENDSSMTADLSDSIPNFMDWLSEMGSHMKQKFEKYWGDPEKMNFLIFYATILDPRDKIEYMPAQFAQLYGDDKGKSCFEKVQSSMVVLFNDYTATYHVQSASPTVQSMQSEPVHSQTSVGKPQARMKSQLKKQRMETGGSSKETELQIYLSEKLVEDEENVDFDVLRWWKVNSDRFPILSKMPRDVLVVPISTVASESAFSTSGRVLDAFRSFLNPKLLKP